MVFKQTVDKLLNIPAGCVAAPQAQPATGEGKDPGRLGGGPGLFSPARRAHRCLAGCRWSSGWLLMCPAVRNRPTLPSTSTSKVGVNRRDDGPRHQRAQAPTVPTGTDRDQHSRARHVTGSGSWRAKSAGAASDAGSRLWRVTTTHPRTLRPDRQGGPLKRPHFGSCTSLRPRFQNIGGETC